MGSRQTPNHTSRAEPLKRHSLCQNCAVDTRFVVLSANLAKPTFSRNRAGSFVQLNIFARGHKLTIHSHIKLFSGYELVSV